MTYTIKPMLFHLFLRMAYSYGWPIPMDGLFLWPIPMDGLFPWMAYSYDGLFL